MSSQSWAAWLLDSYAASVSPVTSEHTDDSVEEPASATTTRSVSSSATSMSPYGPYARTGRGGAGNFHWQSEQTAPQDLEAQDLKQSSLSERRQAAARLERLETGEAMKGRKSSQYMHMGRGGAGNYTQSNDIQSAKSPRVVSSPVYTSTPVLGRGGAGNMMVAHEAKRKLQAEQEERQREAAEKKREEIEHQVEEMLQPPPGAMLSNTRRSSMLIENV